MQEVTTATAIDRERLEQDLRALADALLNLVPEQLRTFAIPDPVLASLRVMGMAVPDSGLDLTSTTYATCSAIAALPDEDLGDMLELIDRELEVLRGRAPAFALTPRELEVVGKVLGELKGKRGT